LTTVALYGIGDANERSLHSATRSTDHVSLATIPPSSEKRTRSPAVARIADRTASQQTVVIITIVLISLVYL